MKSTIAVAFLANAIYVSAQQPYSAPPPPTSQSTVSQSTVTEYYDDCSTISTITDTRIHTWSGANSEAKFLTTYTTVFPDTCSTGLEEKTYTITEPCTNPGESRSLGYVPYGFTQTTVTCNKCGSTPVTATLITPAPAPPAGAGGPNPAPAAPTAGGSPGGSSPPPYGSPGEAPAGGSPAGGSPASPGGSSGSPAGGSPGSPGSPGEGASRQAPAGGSPAAGGAAPPYPNPNNPEHTGVPSGGVSPGTGSPVAPFLGAGTRLSLSISSLITFGAAIGVLAFAL